MHYQTVASATLDLLKNLMKADFLADFRLVGGTSLALQIGHRKSIDLDFFGKTDTPLDEILWKCQGLGQIDQAETVKSGSIILQTKINNIKVDFVKYQYPWLDEILLIDNIRLASKKDIAAMKVAAIGNRGTKKDFVDLYFLLQEFSLSQIMNFFTQKYELYEPFHHLQSLTYFENADLGQDLDMLTDVKWSEVKKYIQDQVKSYKF